MLQKGSPTSMPCMGNTNWIYWVVKKYEVGWTCREGVKRRGKEVDTIIFHNKMYGILKIKY